MQISGDIQLGQKLVDELIKARVYQQWMQDGIPFVSKRIIIAGKEEGVTGVISVKKVCFFVLFCLSEVLQVLQVYPSHGVWSS